MTKRVKVYAILTAMCLALILSVSAQAENLKAKVIPGEPVQIDRPAMIAELVQQWGADGITAGQLEATLAGVNDSTLLAVWNAVSLDEVNAILFGGPVADGTLALGDTDQDYVFTPVTPCRIVDTRDAGGMFSAAETREYYVYDSFDMSYQGGNPAGCPSPVGEPLGVVINVTAVSPTANGNLRAYSADPAVTTPNASLVNYRTGVNIGNAAAVQTYSSIGPPELEIYAHSATHVVIDVMGYYNAPAATALDLDIDYATINVPAGETVYGTSPECPIGYSLTGGGIYNSNADLQLIYSSLDWGTMNSWGCRVKNNSGFAVNFDCERICARTPGR